MNNIPAHYLCMHTEGTNILVEHFFRNERSRLIATLAKLFGLQQLQLAEDIAQEALLDALANWPVNGIPGNPKAWLYRVAKNKAIDVFKRKKHLDTIVSELSNSANAIEKEIDNIFLDDEIKDSQLQMLFACCHPSVPEDGQVMFMLKTLCSLSVAEIARAYLTSTDAVEKRIYRVKKKLREENIQLVIPSPQELLARLDAVLRAIYLLFNEGYNSSQPDRVIRKDLSGEAMRLCELLIEIPLTNLPFTNALMALMCYQSSRFDARMDADNHIITLENQDRHKWDVELINKGHYYISHAITREIISKYQVEAAISYWYAVAQDLAGTNWAEIFNLYNLLIQFDPSPMILLNRLIVQARIDGHESVLPHLLQLPGLEKNHLYYSSIAIFYQQLNQPALAVENYLKAMRLTHSLAEKKLLQDRISFNTSMSF
ncbi:MAG: sigma-70 family RNA polymerase sigma factor [Rhizobacter sp.]|nr:sigma-70 family RNA polymerase sigma factor [Ferruginibacter sp.]